LQRQQNIFTAATKTSEASVQASFIMSQIIAKKLKPFAADGYMMAAEILRFEK
jgi:hypothetical protein